jgi:Fe-S-cluster containining protein
MPMEAQRAQLVQIGDYGDKYALDPSDVDCAARWELCHGVCCNLEFPISEQDFEEGIVAWDPKRPYMCAKDDDGRCIHQDSDTGGCGVYEHRPGPCRTYTCKDDKRVWIDFEAREINPAIHEKGWPAKYQEGGDWPG